MELVLMALSVLQEGRQEGSGYVFTMPAGWTRQDVQAGTMLLPPGAAPAEAALVLYATTPDVPDAPDVVHAKMVQAFTATGAVQGETRTGTLGDYRWSRLTITPPGGAPLRMAIHTAKSGTTAGVAVFAATEERFRRHAADVERLVESLRFKGAPEPAAVHGLTIPFPPGWTRKDDPNGAAVFTPPPPRGPLEPAWNYVLIVLPSQPLRGTHWQTHKAVFKEAMGLLKDPVDPTHSADEPGPFIRSATASKEHENRVVQLSMYSARSAAGIECLVIRGQEDRDGLRAILARATVKNPPKTERPRIVEAYRRGEQKMHVDAQGGLLRPGSLQYERLWLRSDGVAIFATTYPSGYAASPEVLKYDPGLLNGDIGAWEAVGDAVEIVRTAGAKAETGTREGGRLKLGGQLWARMPAVDGLRLEGRWGTNEASIAFTKDGRFTDEGVIAGTAIGDTRRNRPPKRGAGAYEIREWTLLLRYDDGTAWSVDFSTIGPDPADLSSILLSTSAHRKM